MEIRPFQGGRSEGSSAEGPCDYRASLKAG